MSFPKDINFTYAAPSKPKEQIGGTHYSRLGIEPIQFIETNGLGYHEGNVVKYISRWRNKNGIEDLKKALWYVQRLLELEEAALAKEVEPKFSEPLTVVDGLAPGVGPIATRAEALYNEIHDDEACVEAAYPGHGN